jgi:RHS repeat-associated protein
VAVSDATGAGVATSKYSVDGASASLASEFGFTGQLWLPSVQLYYYKARMYSPQLGRFASTALHIGRSNCGG